MNSITTTTRAPAWLRPPAPETCSHRPGVVFAPVFGLPGPRSSVCQDCGRAIERTGAATAWHLA